MRLVLVALAFSLLLLPAASRAAEPLLKPGERLVFLGDSYMGGHGPTVLVMDALALHHPGTAISVRSAFVRDANFAATGLLPFFPPVVDTDVLSVKPAVVLLGFGLERAQARPLDRAFLQRFYVTPLAAMVQKLQAAGAKVILVTPGLIDPDRQPALKGAGEDNVAQMAQAIRGLSRQIPVPLIDVYSQLCQAQKHGKAADPAFSLIKEGKEGPVLTAVGQALVAGAYLRGLGEEGPASGLMIDAATGTTQTDRCTISDLAVTAGRITFTRLDEALPAYFPDAASPALALDPSLASLEQYPLRITGLGIGSWKVTADGAEVGVFPAESLVAGVNLARLPGPWRKLGARLHALAQQQEALYAERCTAVARLTTPPEAEPERLVLMQKFDDYIEAFEKQRIALPPAIRTWAWSIQRLP
jgi:hypothetical protein